MSSIAIASKMCNEIISSALDYNYNMISYLLVKESCKAKEMCEVEVANILELLSLVCEMKLEPKSRNLPFKLNEISKTSASSIGVEWSMNDFDKLESIGRLINEPIIKARIFDFLWIHRKPRKREHVDAAIDSYFSLKIDDETWTPRVCQCWTRAFFLSRQMGRYDIADNHEEILLEKFNEACIKKSSLILWLARFIKENDLCINEREFIGETLFDFAKEELLEKKYMFARQYSSLAGCFFELLDDCVRKYEVLLFTASCHEIEGDSKIEGEHPSQMLANTYYGNALQAYRIIPTKHREKLGVNAKIHSIRGKITASGEAALDEIGVIKTPSIDISDVVKEAIKHVSGKDNHYIALGFFTGFVTTNYSELRVQAIESIKSFPLSNMFSSTHMASDGRIIAKVPSVKLDEESEENNSAIYYKMIEHFKMDVVFHVQGTIIPALHQLLSEFSFTKDFLSELCSYSSFVPEGRSKLMGSALWHGFEFNFSDSIYLLAPQVEHAVRVRLKSENIKTSNIDTDGIETELSLSTLLDCHEVKGIFSDEVTFELKAIFTESTGFNFRNNVAHGLLSDKESDSVPSVYAWWMVLRLVINTIY